MENKKVREMTEEEYRKRMSEIYAEINCKNEALINFKIKELKMERAWGESKQRLEASEKIIEILKKEELTYEQSYATLQQTYNQLEYESNFLKI